MRRIKDEDNAIDVFGALADKTRMNIVKELMDGEKSCSELIQKSNLTKSTFSHHAKILARCGLIKFRREGKFLFFVLERKFLHYSLMQLIKQDE